MPQLLFPLSPDGPTLEVIVGLSAADIAALQSAGQQVPAFVLARAVLDGPARRFSIGF